MKSWNQPLAPSNARRDIQEREPFQLRVCETGHGRDCIIVRPSLRIASSWLHEFYVKIKTFASVPQMVAREFCPVIRVRQFSLEINSRHGFAKTIDVNMSHPFISPTLLQIVQRPRRFIYVRRERFV